MKNLDHQNSTSVCTRCGKPRVISKTWIEEVETMGGTSTLTFTQTICSDVECQQKVDQDLKDQKEKREALKKESEIREHKRQMSLKHSRAHKAAATA